MKNIVTILLLLILSTSAIAQEKSLRAYLSYSTFAVPGSDSYIETYLAIQGSSVVFVENEPGSYQAAIEVTMVFTQGDSIRNFAKYELKSPIVYDLEKTNFGIIDQQRFSLPDGDYNLELQIADINNPNVPAFSANETFQLDYPGKEVMISAIQLVESFEKTTTESVLSKNGFDLIPMVYAYYPESVRNLHFYTEIYNTPELFSETGKYIVTYFLESFESMNQMKDFFFRKRLDAKQVNILLNSIDITNLPSGNYNLVTEVRNQKNEVVTSNKVFLQRSNPKVQLNLVDLSSINVNNTFTMRISNADTLRENLLCLAPLSSEAERDYAFNLTKTNDLHVMRQFLYNFWQNRDYNEPEKAWQNYYQEVQKVNLAYKTQTKKGYASDRGRVYLKYGPPNQIVEVYSEPAAYPYEIWHYYTLGRQRNKRFVFATKDMVTNDFALIHSDAIGELSNYRWQLDVYKRTWDPNSIDETGPEDAFGNRAYDFYKNPR